MTWLAFLAVLFSAAAQETSSDARDLQIRRWIQDLGADDVVVRETAGKKLLDLGDQAVHALRDAAEDSSQERAARARELLAEITVRKRGLLAFWGPCAKPLPHPMGTDSLFIVDPDNPRPQEILRGTYQAGQIDRIEERRRIYVDADLRRASEDGVEQGGQGLFRHMLKVVIGRPDEICEEEPSEGLRSPDGKSAVSVQRNEEDNTDEIVMADADGQHPRRIAVCARYPGILSWMPDASRILIGGKVVIDGVPRSSGLYWTRPDGSGLEMLSEKCEGGPVTPDGKTLVRFESQYPEGPKTVYAFDLTTRKSRVVGAGARYERGVALSPDGTRVTYVRYKDSMIVLANLDGSADKPLAVGDSAVWSPEGGRLAYVREGSLYVFDLATGAERRIAPALADHARGIDPVWFR